jgi:hypothetical protein
MDLFLIALLIFILLVLSSWLAYVNEVKHSIVPSADFNVMFFLFFSLFFTNLQPFFITLVITLLDTLKCFAAYVLELKCNIVPSSSVISMGSNGLLVKGTSLPYSSHTIPILHNFPFLHILINDVLHICTW